MSNRTGFSLSVATLPEGTKLTLNEFLQQLPSLTTVEADEGYATFVTGSLEPSSNEGPWLKDGTSWYVWSEAEGKYIPLVLTETVKNTFTSTSATEPTGTSDGDIWIITDGVNTIEEAKVWISGAWRDYVKSTKNTKDEIYPVGSVYINATSATNPATLLNMSWSSWTQLSNVFLAAFGGSISTSGGSFTKTLSASNLPPHTHGPGSLNGSTTTNGTHTHPLTTYSGSGANGAQNGGATPVVSSGYISGSGEHSHTVSVTGGSTDSGSGLSSSAFDITPPYIGLYVWKRTS